MNSRTTIRLDGLLSALQFSSPDDYPYNSKLRQLASELASSYNHYGYHCLNLHISGTRPDPCVMTAAARYVVAVTLLYSDHGETVHPEPTYKPKS